MNDADADSALEALLRQPLVDLPDNGFTAGVMMRVHGLPTLLEPEDGLVVLQQRQAAARRGERSSRYGAAIGTALALAVLVAADGAPADLLARGAVLALALAISAAVAGWSLLSEPLA
jgi:hypothetical protein